MPQCMDPNCWCNRKRNQPKPDRHEPESKEEIRDAAKALILKLGDDLEWANDTGVNYVLDALDILAATITEVRHKVHEEFPWLKPE